MKDIAGGIVKKHIILVVGLFILLYLVPLGVRPLVMPDETRYGEIPREMIDSGDWVVPCLNGVRYFEKPVLGYWLNAGSIALFGRNAFAVRLPSALAAGVSAFFVFLMVRRYAGGAPAGLAAVAIYLTFGMVFALGVFAVLDSMLTMFVTGTMTMFFFAHKETSPRKRIGFLALTGMFCGLAFLTKGFLAFAVPVVTIVPFLIWERRWKDFLTKPWIPLLVAVVISLPWCVGIALRESDFWRYFIVVEHYERFLGAGGAQHPKPWWYLFPFLVGGLIPWTFLLPSAIRGVRKAELGSSLFRYAVCWCVVPFIGFSFSSGKLGTYILPVFPSLAILVAAGVLERGRRRGDTAFRRGSIVCAAFAGLLAIALAGSQLTNAWGSRQFGEGEAWKWLLGTFALLAWCAICISASLAKDYRRRLAFYCAGPVAFMFCAAFIVPEVLHEEKAPRKFLEEHAHRIGTNTVVVSDNYMSPAVCWHCERSDVYVLIRAGELSYGLGYDEDAERFLTAERFAQLRTVLSEDGRQMVLIVDSKRYAEFAPQLPEPKTNHIGSGFVFAEY